MNIPEEFGSYLLLKKLSEDALGETFRAGKVGAGGGMEQVVLLRVLNGKDMDGDRLWGKISGRAAVQQALRSPNIGSGVDLGRVRSFPYVAYDYISGKNLAALLDQANRQHSPIPTDHALLIAERVALALAVASESKVDDQRVLHGFVVPHLVMVSNEGETRLLGFEAGAGLRDLAAAGWRGTGLATYLAPEAAPGTPLAKADDCYSLGALLFELLTGDRLPPRPADGYAATVDAALLANEGTPIPPALAGLLKKSLVPRDQRIPDAVTWHKSISKLMIDGQFSPTTFNLAFFMHNLFRDEIERESQEMQAEKRLELRVPAAAPALAPAAAMAPGAREPQPGRETTWHGATPPAPAVTAMAGAPNRNPLFLGIAAVLLLALAGGGYYLFFARGKTAAPATAPAPAMTSDLAAAPPAAEPLTSDAAAAAAPAANQEEIQAQISQMFDARSKEMEAKLKQQYDDRIKQLQQQLEESRRAGGDSGRGSSGSSEAATATAEPKPAPPRPVEASSPPAPAPATSSTTPPASSTTAAVNPDPEPARPVPETSAPAPVQAAPRTQVGDLVRPGPGVVAPKLLSLPDPRYPTAARHMSKSAQVDVKVLVDEKGRVLEAERVGAKAGFGFDESAIDVARRATYRPATKDGVKVKMWATLRVAFKP